MEADPRNKFTTNEVLFLCSITANLLQRWLENDIATRAHGYGYTHKFSDQDALLLLVIREIRKKLTGVAIHKLTRLKIAMQHRGENRYLITDGVRFFIWANTPENVLRKFADADHGMHLIDVGSLDAELAMRTESLRPQTVIPEVLAMEATA